MAHASATRPGFSDGIAGPCSDARIDPFAIIRLAIERRPGFQRPRIVLQERLELRQRHIKPALAQYEPRAGYEGIIREAESRINWANHVDITYNLIRGCDPAPGAWTTADGKKLFVFNATKRIARTFSEVKGKKIGEVVAISGGALVVHGQGGFIEIARARPDGGRKGVAAEAGVAVGTILGA